MKYIKKAYQLVNSYPAIILAFLPTIILTAVYYLFIYNGTMTNTFASIGFSILIVIFTQLSMLVTTKMAFVVSQGEDTDREINVLKVLGHGIPRQLLNILIAVAVFYGFAFAYMITIVSSITGIILISTGNFDPINIFTIFLGLDILGKSLVYILSAVFVSMYTTVFLLFLNTELNMGGMIKASIKYTFRNFKKLFIMMFICTLISQVIVWGSLVLYNIINGLSIFSMQFMSNPVYLVLLTFSLLISMLVCVAVVLTWNDEQDKELYLNPKALN